MPTVLKDQRHWHSWLSATVQLGCIIYVAFKTLFSLLKLVLINNGSKETSLLIWLWISIAYNTGHKLPNSFIWTWLVFMELQILFTYSKNWSRSVYINSFYLGFLFNFKYEHSLLKQKLTFCNISRWNSRYRPSERSLFVVPQKS